MYLDFYGLKEYPFNVTSDPSFLYLSDQHREALAYLQYGIEARKGFLEITGEIGAFNGEVQIGVDAASVISTGGPAPTPIAATGDQLNGGLFQGQLVTYSGTVTIVEAANSFGSASLGVTDAFGTTVTVFVDNRAGLSVDDFSVGQELVIVGVPGFFNGNDPGAQLEVIIDTDVTFVT